MNSELPIFLLPGMTPSDRIYDRLVPLLPNATVIQWAEPHSDESLTDYAERLTYLIPTSECYIGGVSFGGIVALEMSRIIHPRGCFLISSIREPRQLPPWFRMWRLMAGRHCQPTLAMIGRLAAAVPKPIRTRSTIRVTKLAGNAGKWHRWATSAVLNWHPDLGTPNVPILHIHGDADTTFPIRYTDPDVVIPKGGHTLPLTHPRELANAMLAMTLNAE